MFDVHVDGLNNESSNRQKMRIAFLLLSGYESPSEEDQLRAIWNEVNVGATGFLDKHELSVVCDHIGMDSMNEQVCEVNIKKSNNGLQKMLAYPCISEMWLLMH